MNTEKQGIVQTAQFVLSKNKHSKWKSQHPNEFLQVEIPARVM